MDDLIPRWLNAAELRRIGGRYVGTIARVFMERVHNRYKREDDQKAEPVIEFTDGYRLIPNIAMRRRLVEGFGKETDDWVGLPLTIVCQRGRDQLDKRTGEVRETWIKHLELPDDRARACPTETADDSGLDDEAAIDAEPIARRRRAV